MNPPALGRLVPRSTGNCRRCPRCRRRSANRTAAAWPRRTRGRSAGSRAATPTPPRPRHRPWWAPDARPHRDGGPIRRQRALSAAVAQHLPDRAWSRPPGVPAPGLAVSLDANPHSAIAPAAVRPGTRTKAPARRSAPTCHPRTGRPPREPGPRGSLRPSGPARRTNRVRPGRHGEHRQRTRRPSRRNARRSGRRYRALPSAPRPMSVRRPASGPSSRHRLNRRTPRRGHSPASRTMRPRGNRRRGC